MKLKPQDTTAMAVQRARWIVARELKRFSMDQGMVAERIDRALYDLQYQYEPNFGVANPTVAKKPKRPRARKAGK